MKESIEDITADIEFQYGKSNTEKNIEYNPQNQKFKF